MKKFTILLFILSLSQLLFAQNDGGAFITNNVLQGGVGLGAVIAVVASWSRNESILWAILHGILGWLYVIYFAVTREQAS